MNIYIRSWVLIAFLALAAGSASAQAVVKPKANWQNLDLQADGVLGISTEKAYAELLKGKVVIPVIVAVLDGGVDIGHEDLRSAIWTNAKEIAGNGKDDDGNGYIDDLHGWNFLGSSKGSFIYDNIDLVRELRAELAKDPSSLQVKRLRRDLDGKATPLREGLAVLEQQRNTLLAITGRIGKPYPSIAEFRAYRPQNDLEMKVLVMVVRGLKGNPGYRKAQEERYQTYKEQLDYWLNLDYDPRAGEEFLDPFYGNGDVKAQLPIHATHVSGIIAADRGNGIGVKGVASCARLMVLRVIPSGQVLDQDMARAIRYAADNGAKVINISANKDSSPGRNLVDSAVRYAMSKDVLIIHAAGNQGRELEAGTAFPARDYLKGGQAEAWIEVGASGYVDDKKLIPWFSNFGGKTVDVFAPGLQIRSTFWPEKYSVQNGTSMATPVVSGLAAIIRAYYPKLSAIQVKEIILKSVVKREVLRDKCISGGVVNAYEALKLASSY